MNCKIMGISPILNVMIKAAVQGATATKVLTTQKYDEHTHFGRHFGPFWAIFLAWPNDHTLDTPSYGKSTRLRLHGFHGKGKKTDIGHKSRGPEGIPHVYGPTTPPQKVTRI